MQPVQPLSSKSKNKTYKVMILTILVIVGFALLFVFGIEALEQMVYDANHQNEYISRQNEIDLILNGFKTVPYRQLPEKFKKDTKMQLPKYQHLVQNQLFYVLHKKDLYKRIVGNIRIKDLFSRDLKYYNTYYFSDDTLYWGIDRRILYKVLELQDLLSNKDYDRDALHISYGHRSPALNQLINAAPLSRHIAGQAVDITVADVDKSGTYTQKDKDIILDLCDKYIIKDKGGIGLYPGTRVVHMDVGGYKARWDSY